MSDDRVGAIVLGGCGGIGAAITERVAPRCRTLATFTSNEGRAQALRARLALRGDVDVMRCDATDERQVVAAFDAAEARGPLRVVVHCVGGWDYPNLVDLTSLQIDESLALNLKSGLLVLREAARRVEDGGRVVLLSSVAAAVAPARQSTYAAAKAGLEVAARVAAKELALRSITVNVVRPGATDTDTLRGGTSERAIEAMSVANAMRRLGRPDDIAGVVESLLFSDVGWLTGCVIDATGGLI
jgi:3-oxoacyl-[acyl-carrier protein] reductase